MCWLSNSTNILFYCGNKRKKLEGLNLEVLVSNLLVINNFKAIINQLIFWQFIFESI